MTRAMVAQLIEMSGNRMIVTFNEIKRKADLIVAAVPMALASGTISADLLVRGELDESIEMALQQLKRVGYHYKRDGDWLRFVRIGDMDKHAVKPLPVQCKSVSSETHAVHDHAQSTE